MMAKSPVKTGQDEAPPAVPQTTPTGIGYGHPEYQFVQAIMEMQKSIGEVKSSIEALKSSVDGTKAKVDDLVNWKHKILGGAAVLGAVVAIAAFTIGKFWDYVSIKAPTQISQPSIPALPPVPQPPQQPGK